jgi:hypothetical protein
MGNGPTEAAAEIAAGIPCQRKRYVRPTVGEPTRLSAELADSWRLDPISWLALVSVARLLERTRTAFPFIEHQGRRPQ